MRVGILKGLRIVLLALIGDLICLASASAISISNFTPTSGTIHDIVTINGNNFTSSPTITFTGARSQNALIGGDLISATNTQIKMYVPQDANTGPITVKSSTGATVTSTASFTLVSPTVLSFFPPSGSPGTSVNIAGTYFGGPGYNKVYFNGVQATTLTTNSSTSLTVTVPAGATTGLVKVVVASRLSDESDSQFVVGNTPTISGLSASSGLVGSGITITGTNFATTSTGDVVQFNGVTAIVQPNSTSTKIYTNVPAGATTGPISVTVNGLTGSSSSFAVTTSTAVVTTIAGLAGSSGTSDGAGSGARFNQPSNVTVDGFGNAYISDQASSTVRKMTSAGVVTTFAGQALVTGSQDGVGSAARFNFPQGLGIDTASNVVLADYANNTIRRIAPDRTVVTIAGLAASAGSSDGTGSGARFSGPLDTTVDASGNIIVADFQNNTIRKISPSGVVSTLAGSAGLVGSTDGTGSAARFHGPSGIALDQAGNMFVTDTDNHTIREVTPAGVVTTVAGSAGVVGDYDGAGPDARFGQIWDIAADAAGNLYVADSYASIREIATDGSVTTIAGLSGFPGSVDGVGAQARFQSPTGIAIDSCGNLLVTDPADNTIRKVALTANCPNAPTISVPSMSSSTTFNVSWTPSASGPAATSFQLQQATSPNGPWTSVNNNISASQTTYAVTVGGGGTFYYEVRACIGNACSPFVVSNAITVTSPPNAPTSVSVPSGSATGTFSVSWVPSASGSPATYFKLQQGPTATGAWTLINGNIPSAQTSLSVTVGTGTYYYEVAACNTAGCSSYTVGGPIVVTPPPNAPTVTVQATSSTATVTVSWTPSATGGSATSFQVARSTTGTGNWLTVAPNLPATARNYQDTVPGNGTYYYQVTACNASGCASGVSSGVVVNITVTPPNLPPAATARNDLPMHDPTVGTMAGEAGTDGGAATYTIPIVVPPGRAGMQPNLALTYNSRSGNGVMGVGWSISGLSSIHRCPRTMEQDGQTLGVSYNSTDRLCLDGMRLVPAPGFTIAQYGLSGTHYRTEIDSYADIVQNGGNLTSLSTYFVVQARDGRVSTYGQGAGAQVKPGGASYPLSWLVQQVQDRVGNNEVYSYVDYTNGEVLLASVAYTGYTPTSTAGDRKVAFTYQARTSVPCVNGVCVNDVSSSYLAGGLTMQTKALQLITTTVGGFTARTYTPHYVPAQYSNRLLMSSIIECASDPTSTKCHPATQFSYNDDTLNQDINFPFVALNGSTAISIGTSDQNDVAAKPPVEFHSIGDLDGDGTRETAVAVAAPTGGVEQYYLTQTGADRTANAAVNLTGTGFAIDPNFFVDIDGDGRAELMKIVATNGSLAFGAWKLGRGTALPAGATYSTLFSDYVSSVSGQSGGIPFGAGDTFFTADMNGDGRMDVVRVVINAGQCTSGYKGVFIYPNNTTGTLGSSGNTTVNFSPPVLAFCLKVTTSGGTSTVQAIDHISDFNGDGLPDFFLRSDTGTLGGATTTFDGVQVAQAGGTSFTMRACGSAINLVNDPANSATDVCTWAQPGADTNYVTFMDINGDGLDDIVLARPSQQTWRVILNKGGTFGAEINTGNRDGLDKNGANGNSFRYPGRLPTMDVDSDGKQDLLIPSKIQGLHGFAQKVCTAVVVPASNFGTDESCPLPGGLNAPSTPDGPGGKTCSVYSCPQDPGGSLSMPAETWDVGGYNYGWNGLPAFGSYGATGGNFPVPGLDNSTYHIAMLKFEQTGATQISVELKETPLVSRLSGLGVFAGRADGLFGDGLSDLTTVVGCTNAQITNGSGTYNQCATIADDVYGPGASHPLPDGTPTCNLNADGSCFFDENPTLYVGINQGVTAFGGSLSKARGPQPGIAAVATVTTSSPLAGWPTLPGLLYSSTNGLGDFSQWFYAPLSLGFKYKLDGILGYNVTGAYVDSRHYYFASSMPVVYEMFQSTGIGTLYGFRGAAFDYSNAMYNRFGRGFQGFQSITKIVGNPTDTDNRVTDTITTFNQKFPLTGRISSIQVLARDLSGETTHTVSQETDAWTCFSNRDVCPLGNALPTPTGTGAYQPVLDSQVLKTYDLSNGALMAEVDTLNVSTANSLVSGWDTYGNLTGQTVTHVDKGSSSTLFLDSSAGHKVQTTNTYAAPDTVNWWINKLLSSAASSSITFTSGRLLPPGTSAPSQTINTSYTWNPDRTPQTKTIQNGTTNQQAMTTWCYPGVATAGCSASGSTYGLPSSVIVTAPDLSSALSPTRTTGYVYTSDGTNAATTGGYFVLQTTNALNETTTTRHQTNDGQVTLAVDANGVQLKTTYDVFGRPTQVQRLDTSGADFESPIFSSYTACSSGFCSGGVGEDGNEGNAAYRVTTTEAGSPTKVVWYDLLGRPIKNAEAVYTGTTGGVLNYKFSATLTRYDDMGVVSDLYPPYFVGVTPACYFAPPWCFTSFVYDSLGRPIQKVEPRSEMDSVHGDLKTDYAYSGRKTTIVAHSASITPSGGGCPTGSTTNLCLEMTRSTNALGQLMQTTESPVLTSGSKHLLQTNYWTEPLGHVAAIKDAEGNITSATYNQLGQRTQSIDPDQGTWNFQYDAFGELLSQTDARGAVTTVTSIDALGHMLQRKSAPPTSVPIGMANDTIVDTFSYALNNGATTYCTGKGELCSAARQRGTVMPYPTVWQETYGYESTTARPSATTTSISEGSTPQSNLSSQTVYESGPPGRVLKHQYPSGLTVLHRYTAYGQLDALSNDGTGYVYWTSVGQNQWQHTVSEQFPGVITGTYVDYDTTGQAKTLTWSGSTADQMTYNYDSFGNLIKQTRAAPYSNNETYTYDAVQRLINASRASGNVVSYGYSDSGNLTSKTDFGTGSYSYGAINSRTSGCGPHAVYAVGGTSYSCDANGNVVGGSTLTTTFDVNNQARTATRVGTGNITWAYNANGERDYENDAAGERYFVGDNFRIDGAYRRHELGSVVVTTRAGSSDTIAVELRDRLGSTLNVIDNGVATVRQYDAFGKPRNGDMTDRSPATLGLPTIFGFTDHEHDDSVLLIHMKGRVLDYQLGRFLSVDPIIRNPANSQSLNAYSYIGNNPLSGTDPTGYEMECHGSAGTDCDLTNVQSIKSQNIDGKVVRVATDDQGNQVIAKQYSYTDSNGAQHVVGFTEPSDRSSTTDPSAIGSLTSLNITHAPPGGTASGGSYTNAMAASYLGGFTKTVSEGVALALMCGNSTLAAAACMAYGAGESAAHNPQGASFIAAGAGGGFGRGGAEASEKATASAQGIRGPATAEELEIGPVKPGDTGTYGGLKAQKQAYGETEPLHMDHQPSFAAQVRAKEAAIGRPLTKDELTKLKANTPAVASPRQIHQQTSPTYGGRNTPGRIREDAANLQRAGLRDRAVFDEAMDNR